MDRMIYVALTGARESMRSQSTVSQNLANATTTGFRAVRESMTTAGIEGPGFQTRVNPVSLPDSFDATGGVITQTGRDLDVAIEGNGWLAVQDGTGNEAYTRAGDLRVNASGMLETGTGKLVLGNGGPVSIPQFQQIFVGNDGQISVVPLGQNPDTLVTVDRIRLVNPPAHEMTRGADGLFRMTDGSSAPPDANVRVNGGQLESSNVNPAVALVQMIELSRSYDMQVRSMKAAEDNDAAASKLMRSGG